MERGYDIGGAKPTSASRWTSPVRGREAVQKLQIVMDGAERAPPSGDLNAGTMDRRSQGTRRSFLGRGSDLEMARAACVV